MNAARRRIVLLAILLLAASLVWAVPASAAVRYVKADAIGANNGTNWTDAYTHVQTALGAAVAGDEIWVAAGTYMPDGGLIPAGEMHAPGSGDRTATFQLLSGVAIYGGFAGSEDPATFDLVDRDFAANETTLSGDLNGDDAPIANPSELLNDPTRADNSYHVLTSLGTDATAIIDGFRIRGGNNSDSRGAGMYNNHGSPTVTNCIFSGNSAPRAGALGNDFGSLLLTNCRFGGNFAAQDGGGMVNNNGSPTLTNCTFSENWAPTAGGMINYNSSVTLTDCTFSDNRGVGFSGKGGGMVNYDSNAMLTGCTFSGNRAFDGGGMVNYSSSPALANCTFSANSASADGGGMLNEYESHPLLTNCTFGGNAVFGRGGGMFNRAGCSPELIGCTFSANSAHDGGGMLNDFGSGPELTNCTFSGNSAWENGGALYNVSVGSPIRNLVLTNCTFSANSAVGGGGIHNYYSSPSLTNCTFVGNQGTQYGGGLLNRASSNATLKNCTFMGNSVEWAGGAIANLGSAPLLTNCTLRGNSALYGYGGAIHNEASSLTLVNCVVWGNAAFGPFQVTLSGAADVTYSNIQGGQSAIARDLSSTLSWGPGNIDLDPLITPDGHLGSGSPCVDAGTATGAPSADRDGENRPQAAGVDLGSDEFLDSDGDGLPDWWEAQYFGSNAAGDSNADPDGDGLTNLQEYEQYGSNPAAAPIYVCNACDPSPNGSIDHPWGTIQAGLDAADDGDTVLVLEGVYSGAGNRNLDYAKESVLVRSWNGTDPSQPSNVTVDCGGSARAVDPPSVQNTFAVLKGFTIANGLAARGKRPFYNLA